MKLSHLSIQHNECTAHWRPEDATSPLTFDDICKAEFPLIPIYHFLERHFKFRSVQVAYIHLFKVNIIIEIDGQNILLNRNSVEDLNITNQKKYMYDRSSREFGVRLIEDEHWKMAIKLYEESKKLNMETLTWLHERYPDYCKHEVYAFAQYYLYDEFKKANNMNYGRIKNEYLLKLYHFKSNYVQHHRPLYEAFIAFLSIFSFTRLGVNSSLKILSMELLRELFEMIFKWKRIKNKHNPDEPDFEYPGYGY
jgi:hypothetical protein